MSYGPFEQIQKDGSIPVLDIGIIKHIRKGHIKIYEDIDHIEGSTVHFIDNKKKILMLLLPVLVIIRMLQK